MKKWISKEANGYIFVWYHAENEQPWDLKAFDVDKLNLHFTFECILHSHVQDIYENTIDQGEMLQLLIEN